MAIRPFICPVCFQPITEKMYKVDEQGRAMHEECHAIVLLHRPKEPASAGLLSRLFAKIVRR